MLAFLSARVALALHFAVWAARPTLLQVDSVCVGVECLEECMVQQVEEEILKETTNVGREGQVRLYVQRRRLRTGL
jgi:hypothetical protein